MGTLILKRVIRNRTSWDKIIPYETSPFLDRVPALTCFAVVRYYSLQNLQNSELETREQVKGSNGPSEDSLFPFPPIHSKIDEHTDSINNALSKAIEPKSDVSPYFSPTFNFAAYVNKSPSLQELVKLGVDLHKLETRKGILEFILHRDFERDMKPFIRFLYDTGVEANELGAFLTKNPLIFKEDLDDLAVRVNYLESKKFSKPMVARVISQNPYWLMFSSRRIDRRLGHFQKTFALDGNEVRKLTVKQPRLITYNMNHIKINTFVIKEELGFSDGEMKELLLEKPRLWMINQIKLKKRFDYVHNVMKISHEQLLKYPQILGSREFRIKQRHLFLESLGRAQYNPKLEGFVPLNKLISETDVEFCLNIAKVSVWTFNEFLKTL